MNDDDGRTGGQRALAGFAAAIDQLRDLDLVGLSRTDLLDFTRDLERQRRRLAQVDHRVVAELDDRRVAAELCLPNTRALLRGLLRISPGEASRRVRAAADLGPRRGLTGDVLPPIFYRIAAAVATGAVSLEHAQIIRQTVDQLPYALQAEYEARFEAELVEHAHTLDPVELNRLATRMLQQLDPDGALTEADHERQRKFTYTKNPDGSSTSASHFDPTVTALLDAFLDAHAAPVPSIDGTPDPRRPGQRNHDALKDGLTRLVNGDRVGGGAQLLITMTADDFESRQGLATTGHGDLISVPRALELAADGQVMCVQFDAHGGVMSYGRNRRLVSPAMRMAITARDQGCTFPGCDCPPAWTQAHHFREFIADLGPTSIDNCGLVCGYHHREFRKRGWKGERDCPRFS
jgi:hypothetical protein